MRKEHCREIKPKGIPAHSTQSSRRGTLWSSTTYAGAKEVTRTTWETGTRVASGGALHSRRGEGGRWPEICVAMVK